jgi:hypothetical protein
MLIAFERCNAKAPRIGREKRREARPLSGSGLLTCINNGVSEGIRTPDIQDHNLAL